ncbi:MAG: hypothetical protein IH901_07735, partial [Proteobacteria bacterium]|nr:hypothetical protein [Pseudomonadota bacterium]
MDRQRGGKALYPAFGPGQGERALDRLGLDDATVPEALAVMMISIVICCALAAASYVTVERPARNYLNTSFTETPTSIKREGRPSVKVHPDDLAALGLGDGARVRVGNRRADIVVHAEAFDGL